MRSLNSTYGYLLRGGVVASFCVGRFGGGRSGEDAVDGVVVPAANSDKECLNDAMVKDG